MVNLGELNRTSLPTGTLIPVDQLPQMEIIHLQGELNRANYQINRLEQRIDDNANNAEARIASIANVLEKLTNIVSDIEKVKIAQFKNKDVYEVNKRIERLHGKIALLESNSNLSAVSVNFILVLIAINNLFLGLVWWIYG